MSSALQSTATTASNTPAPSVGMRAQDSVAVPPETPSEHTVVSGSASIAHSHNDVEKQPIAPPQMPTFPEGSLRGWLTVAGAWLVIFSTFGMANTFGVFQSYYQFEGYPNETASTISWVGSVQLFFQFALGAVSGPLYDRGYFYYLFVVGSVIYIVSLFMLSLTHAFWQVFLAQALGIGIGSGLLFLPAMSIVSQYFLKRRALAIGIVTTGSSVGGICLPIMLNNLIQSHGYRLAVQYTGYLILGSLVLAGALMRTRVDSPGMKGPKPSVGSLFQSKAYCMLVGGTFAVAWGLFFPLFYIQVFAESKGIDKNLVFYSLAILNAASVFGRLSPNFLADLFGSLNLITVMCAGAGVIAFAVFGAGSNGGLIAVAIFYGFFSGGYVSLISPSVISLAKSHNEIGLRLGMCFLITSLAALTGTPITGALLDRFGFYAPITWSGIFIFVGSALFAGAAQITKREKGTWKV